MKIILIDSPSPYLFSPNMHVHLGILYIAAVLRDEGHDVQIINSNLLMHRVETGNGLVRWELDPRQSKTLPHCDILGVSATTPNFHFGQKLAKAWPADIRVLGGPHATHASAYSLDGFDGFDLCVIGEAERAIVDVAGGKNWKQIPGLRWLDNRGQLHDTGCALLPDVAKLPFPAFDLWPELPDDTLITKGQKGNRQKCAAIITSRGCPYGCNFCANANAYLRYRPVKHVLDEAQWLFEKFSVTGLRIQDDTFTVRKERVRAISEGLGGLGIQWRCHTRVNLADKDLFRFMARNGCIEIGFGVESGSNKMLKLMGKRTTAEMNKKAIQICQEAGVNARAFIIVGFPGETIQTIEETIGWILETRPDMITCSIFQPYPGNDVWNHPEKYGISLQAQGFENWWQVGLEGSESELTIDLPGISKKQLNESRLRLIDIIEREIGPRDRTAVT